MDLQSLFYTLGIIFIIFWLTVLSGLMVLIFIVSRKLKDLGNQAGLWSEGVTSFVTKLNSKPVSLLVTILPLMPVIMGF
jgi:hypothetical protein